MHLSTQVVIGIILGTIFGALLPEYTVYVKPLGDAFLRAITMLMPVLIYLSLVVGITNIGNNAELKKIGLKATIAFVITTFCAILLGIVVAITMRPGDGVHIELSNAVHNVSIQEFKLSEFLVNIVPSNALAAMTEYKVLQVFFLAIFTGIVMNQMQSNVQVLKSIFQEGLQLVLKILSTIIKVSPYATFALMAWVVSSQGMSVLMSLSKLVVVVIFAMFCQYLIFGLLIYIFARISPLPFYKKSFEYQLIALSSSSSKVALPVTMRVCSEKMGISKMGTSFVLPLGAAINMDGLAIYLSLCAIFVAQITGIELILSDYLMIVLTATFGSIGGAGIPSAAIIMLPTVLASAHLPIEGMAIIIGVDRILDMLRTTISITGDAAITLIIDAREKSLNKTQYYS